MSLGEIHIVDDRTVLVVGQELDFERKQPDAANALLHRVGDTLFLVDTGVTEPFRAALTAAAERVGPWRDVVLLTTHGHVDHIGNDDLIDELAAAHGGSARHFLPAPDVAQVLDPQDYWARSFGRVSGVVPLPAPPSVMASTVVGLFQPMHPFAAASRTFESLPLQRLTLGTQQLAGWSFADGAVQVVRSQGHCAGHVMVVVRDAGLLHVGDEMNGACGTMVDADQAKLLAALEVISTLLRDGQVRRLTDGHTFAVQEGPAAQLRVDTLLDQALALRNGSLELLDGSSSVSPATFAGQYADLVTRLGVGGANPNPAFLAMMAVNTLREIGFTGGRSAGDVWTRADPLVASAAPGPAQQGAARMGTLVAFLGWKVRGRDRHV